MAKSKYDRNVDKGAAQQRNTGQAAAGGYNRSGATGEETVGGQPSSGNPKYQGGSHKRKHGQSGGSTGQNKTGSGDNG